MDRITFTGTVLGIDPGPRESAYCRLHDGVPYSFGLMANDDLLYDLRYGDLLLAVDDVVIETIFPRGTSVGLETMDTQFWAGRFAECADRQKTPWHKIDRQDVRFAICGSLNTDDASVRTALIDWYGGSKEAAIGKKAKPGPLWGIKEDMWSALAIALAFELRKHYRQPLTRGA
jgi:hypothetical protein